MKIVMFGHKRVPSREGGIEVVVEELSARMVQRGHEVLCFNRGGYSAGNQAPHTKEYRGIGLKTVPTLNKKGLAAVSSSFFGALYAAIGSADVVHIHAEGPAFFCWIPKIFRKQVVVTVHGMDWKREKWEGSFASRFIRWGEKMAVRFADEIIVLSRSAQEYFRDAYSRETVWIPNGVEKVVPAEANLITGVFGLQKDGYILFLGRLVPEKRIHDLICAFRDVHTDKKLVIAGDASDTDDYCRELRKLAVEDDRILFTGFVQGKMLEELYSNAWVYVLPSVTEGMPLSLLEAMSYGNCCLVSDIPECREVVGDAAPVFPAGDVEKLRENLQRLCDDPETVISYRGKIREEIAGKYSWDDVTKRTLELYQ